jgi:enoyl-CoA hydratase
VILTGTGKIFSAGVDLLQVNAGGTAYVQTFLPSLHRLFDTVFDFPKPVVAAVNGHAIAGGCVLACCADRRIAARDSGRIGVTEVLVGVPFPAMAFEVMRFATQPHYFPDVILSGATYPSEDALTRGLIDEVVESAALMDRAFAVAQALAALPPATFALTKEQIRQPVTDRMVRHGKRVDDRVDEIWYDADTLKHIGAYVAGTFKKGA